MLQPETYKEWTAVSWPGSVYKGKWAKGENLRFISTSGEGTLATVVEHTPYEHILAKHIAVIKADGSEDRESDMAKGWVGTLERYRFNEQNGKTDLTVEIDTSPDWESMFAEGWPNALAKLKQMCEN
jgi:hypothetical protein